MGRGGPQAGADRGPGRARAWIDPGDRRVASWSDRVLATVSGGLPDDHTEIDYLLTADFAEVINGKTYIMGGGWDAFTPPQYPAPIRLGIAVGIRVPFLESNVPHHMTVVLRHEAIEYFRKGGRADLERQEEAEMAILRRFLPQALSEEELRALIRSSIEEVGAKGVQDLGKVMKQVMPKVTGRTEGKRVNELAREILAG